MDTERDQRSDGASSAALQAAEAERDLAQLHRAEGVIVWLRWFAVAGLLVILARARHSAPGAVVWGLYSGVVAYSAVAHWQVRRGRNVRIGAIATTFVDATCVAVVCAVTGGIQSDVYPYFYITVLATAIRFDARETFVVVALNALLSTLLYVATPDGGRGVGELLLRIFYLFFSALLGGLLSREARENQRLALREGDKARLLLAVHREISATLDLPELLRRLLEQAIGVISCRGAAVILLDRSSQRIDRAVVAGDLPGPPADAASASLASGLLARARAEGALVLEGAEEILGAGGFAAGASRNVAVLPIRHREELGFLVIADKAGDGRFSSDEVDLLRAVADQAAVAIENARLVEDVRHAGDRIRGLLWQLIDAEEDERKRIAGEIHDRMGRRVFELAFAIDRTQQALGERSPEASALLARLADETRGFADEVRSVMNELRPPVLDDFGFSEALREYAVSLEQQGDLDVSLSVDGGARSPRPEVNVTLFRILQEAVLNVRKHAAARRLAIEFRADDGSLRLVIRDDGNGFDPAAARRGHYGLLYMRERAEACGGKLDIQSRPGSGTEVRVSVPAA
jgi:signal transduction histidine kinase